MNTRDFFRMIIKLFGLYSLILSTFYLIASNLIPVLYEMDVWSLVFVSFSALIVFGLYYLLLNKVDAIIDFLKLDKGFDATHINLGNLKEGRIISLAVIIIGGFLIVDYAPSFLYNCYISFRQLADNGGGNHFNSNYFQADYFSWGLSVIGILVGYLLIANHSFISKKLSDKIEDL